MIDEANGNFIYFAMIYSMADEASEFAALVAQAHGLVCFDPQEMRMRPSLATDGPPVPTGDPRAQGS